MLIRHALAFLPAQLLSPLAQLASMVLWTHWLAPAQMGLFTLVTVTQEITQLIGLAWFSTYALRYLPPASDVQGRARLLQTERSVLLVFGAVSVLAAAATAAMLPVATPWGSHFLAMAACFVSRASNVHYAERARAQTAFVAYTLLQCCGPVLGLAFGWWGLHHFEAQATTLWWAYALAQTIGSLLAVPMMGVQWRLRRPDPAVLRAAVKFGLPMVGLWALAWGAENVLRYQVQWQAGPAALGLMAVGWGLGRRCASVASMLVATAAFPLAARLLNEGRKEEAMAAQSLNLALVCAVLAPATLAVEMLGTDFVALLVAPQYRETSAQVLGLAMLSGAIRSLQVHTCGQALVLANRVTLALWVNMLEIGATLVCAGVGLHLHGLRGAAAGACVGAFLALLLSAMFTRRYLGLRWPWAYLGRIALGVAAMGVVLHLVHTEHSLGAMALSAVAGSLAYGLALAAMWPQHVLAFIRPRRDRPLAPPSTVPSPRTEA
jgi:O-antigen/teichoic acid export membrane protein